MAKKIKVRITDEVSSFGYEGTSYSPGDVVTISENQFVPYFMEKVEEPKPPKKEKAVATEIALEPAPTVTEPPEEPKKKVSARRKK